MPRNLPVPQASAPILFGGPAPPADLLDWSWAEDRLISARNYWIATTRPDGRPHCRPVWGVWLSDGFWFSTGSLARHNLATRPSISVNLEDDDGVVVLEGISTLCTDLSDLQHVCDVYGPKYDYPLAPTEDGEVRDAGGTGRATLPCHAERRLWLEARHDVAYALGLHFLVIAGPSDRRGPLDSLNSEFLTPTTAR